MSFVAETGIAGQRRLTNGKDGGSIEVCGMYITIIEMRLLKPPSSGECSPHYIVIVAVVVAGEEILRALGQALSRSLRQPPASCTKAVFSPS